MMYCVAGSGISISVSSASRKSKTWILGFHGKEKHQIGVHFHNLFISFYILFDFSF